ncbi:phosphate signaling complex protein PhoU [Mycolicibacterium arenosum]|uniref:Phosphate-specific transport system accessory protein PhoU n=1 Tax=Mycolicibacterium arenosum TaxID=2952157 RepID=A0ABT1M6M1_9MYCO|nr:phosphate signaling complex protein PhoU [Mycolicibacterium sp. CAU 1645]MCP9274215.1 phosphate signaling complex protein PhoU [Mycolicibacterium sp. CAU 1645]
MRTTFHAELDRLAAELGAMCATAGSIMSSATAAVVYGDMNAADRVWSELSHLSALNQRVQDRTLTVLARQAPVARELRFVVSAIRIAGDADRMGGLAANVAKVAQRNHPAPAIPSDTTAHFAEMGRVAVELANRAHHALADFDADKAREVGPADREMNDLHRRLFTLVSDATWTHGAAAAVDVALLGRFYERFADHAVEIARRIVFEATGETPERTDYEAAMEATL